MIVGLDIDNVIADLDAIYLEYFLEEDKNKRNSGIINKKAKHITQGMFDWSAEEVDAFISDKMDEIIEEFATKVNMHEFLDAEPTNLSGGQKQRVAIAGVLAMQPDLLILDEATSMLDPTGKKEIFEVIHNLKEKRKDMSILSITHHIEEAIQADEIIIINNGKVIKIGTPEEILYDHQLLEENALEAPFVVQLIESLKKANIDVPQCLSEEELVKYL